MGVKVTAVITTCRREWSVIERAIKSVEGQICPPCEILLVDDNQPDSDFSRIIREKIPEHPLVRYLSLGGNHGVAYARNSAYKAAAGDWVAYLDDDDEWFPDKLQMQLEVLKAHPKAGIIFGLGLKWNDDTQLEEGLTWSSTIFKERPTFKDMLANDHIGSASQPMIRKEALEAVGGFQTEGIPAVEDYELWIRIIRKYRGYGINKALYRKHMNNMEHVSRNRNRTFQGYRYIYHEFRPQYRRLPSARKNILWNVVREGVKAKNYRVFPYFLQWFWLKWIRRV